MCPTNCESRLTGCNQRFFRDLSSNALRRGVFTNVGNLIEAIDAYLVTHNERRTPFV